MDDGRNAVVAALWLAWDWLGLVWPGLCVTLLLLPLHQQRPLFLGGPEAVPCGALPSVLSLHEQWGLQYSIYCTSIASQNLEFALLTLSPRNCLHISGHCGLVQQLYFI
jgi:hypothetical protein